MSEVRQAARSAGSHFFDPDTTRFFRSKYPDTAIRLDVEPRVWVFWTSEQFVATDGTKSPRAWSVRVFVDGDGHMMPIPDDESVAWAFEFQAHQSMGAACAAIFDPVLPYLLTRFG